MSFLERWAESRSRRVAEVRPRKMSQAEKETAELTGVKPRLGNQKSEAEQETR